VFAVACVIITEIDAFAISYATTQTDVFAIACAITPKYLCSQYVVQCSHLRTSCKSLRPPEGRHRCPSRQVGVKNLDFQRNQQTKSLPSGEACEPLYGPGVAVGGECLVMAWLDETEERDAVQWRATV
jgi:hypothetical protein